MLDFEFWSIFEAVVNIIILTSIPLRKPRRKQRSSASSTRTLSARPGKRLTKL